MVVQKKSAENANGDNLYHNVYSHQVKEGVRTTEFERSIHFKPELTSFLFGCN
jgi:hypothetical protein